MAKLPESVVNVNEISRISTGTTLKGTLVSDNDIRVDGSFEGRIESKGKVVIGEKAFIKGDIYCQNIDLEGTVSGNLYVSGALFLKDGCKVTGNLNVRRLSVELGAEFNGNCKMFDADSAEFPAPEAEATE